VDFDTLTPQVVLVPAETVRLSLCPVVHGKFPTENPYDLIKELVQLADRSGFYSIWIEDHFDLPDKEIRACEGDPMIHQSVEAWTTLSSIATWTQRIMMGTEVTPIPLRHPAILAKNVTTVDILSKGRVILGAGVGWNRSEFESFGIPFLKYEDRFEQMDEAIEIMKRLWTEPVVNYAGKHYKLKDARLAPKPVQKPHPPIWFGGFSDRLLEAVARHGNGWIHGTNVSPEKIKSDYDRLRQIAQKHGRNVDEIEVVAPFMCHVARDKEQARKSIERYVERGQLGDIKAGGLGKHFDEGTRLYSIWGTPNDCIEKIERYAAATGVRHFVLDIRPATIALETVQLLSDEVVPHFQRK
jgi:probable F420-dependent oxidoreductase